MPDETGSEWIRSAPWLRRAPNWFMLRLWSLWGFRVSGIENVPGSGPVILIGNHVALLDGPVMMVAASLAGRYSYGLGKAELYNIPLVGWYLRKAGTIPLERKKGDVAAMRTAIEWLRAGRCVSLMPEGTRSKDGRPGRPKAGVGFLAGRTGAVVVPAHLLGTDKWPGPCRLEVRFGPGLRFEGDVTDHAACLAFAQRAMDAVFAL